MPLAGSVSTTLKSVNTTASVTLQHASPCLCRASGLPDGAYISKTIWILTVVALLEHVYADINTTLRRLGISSGEQRRRGERRAECRVTERDVDERGVETRAALVERCGTQDQRRLSPAMLQKLDGGLTGWEYCTSGFRPMRLAGEGETS